MRAAIHRGLAAAMAVLALAGAAQAATVTITFDELDDADYEGLGEGEAGNVNYLDGNHGLYGATTPYLSLGDDGYTSATLITADPGTYFTPVSADLLASTALVAAPCPGCTPEEAFELQDACSFDGMCSGFEPYGFANLSIAGYRDGEVVALDLVGDPAAFYSGTYEFSADFAGIDALEIEVLSTPGALDPANVYACGWAFFSGCVIGSVDNLTVATFQPPGGPASVPLPATLPALALGLGGLVALRRRAA